MIKCNLFLKISIFKFNNILLKFQRSFESFLEVKYMKLRGTGQLCTKTSLLKGSNKYEGILFASRVNFSLGALLHKYTYAQKVIFQIHKNKCT